MIYTLIINKRSYDLPKKTLDIVERMDEIIALDADPKLSTREKYQKILDFIGELVGSDKIEEIFGADELGQMDLSEIVIAFRKIVDAYNKPVQDFQQGQTRDRMRQLPVDELNKLAAVLDKVQDLHD